MPKKSSIRSTDNERGTLNPLVKKRGVAAQRVRRASILLKADADGPNGTDAWIAEASDGRTQTVENMRERLVTEGFEAPLQGKPKCRVRRTVRDGVPEAKVIALRVGRPPNGFSHWTLRLLAEQAVTREIVASIRHETVRRSLKRMAGPTARFNTR